MFKKKNQNKCLYIIIYINLNIVFVFFPIWHVLKEKSNGSITSYIAFRCIHLRNRC